MGDTQQREEVFASPWLHPPGLPALKSQTPFENLGVGTCSRKVVLLSTFN